MENILNIDVPVQENITARFYKQTNSYLLKWNLIISKTIKRFPSLKKYLLKFHAKGELVGIDEKHNVICKAGFNALIKTLVGDTTYTGEINKMLLGTGVGATGVNDTQLITEAYRNDTASGVDSDNIVYLTAFFTEAEVTGTFTEFGNVIDGTASANTGKLWSHLTGLSWVKDGVTSLTIDCKYTFASV
jgi:hypothetical protein